MCHRRVLLYATFSTYTLRQNNFQTSGLFNNGFCDKNEDIVMAFSPPKYCRLFV